ncbi:MAG TPA: hypothetical protein VMU09_08005 [Acidimicrobiales bacterium]|nr:hypothetical protein [Acidimicrobiales bacterium]
MGRSIDTGAGRVRTHLVTLEPLKGRHDVERVWCTCGAEGEFPIDALVEDWALSHPAELEWMATKAS